tara:strand:- start:56 stop:586 length:531 start_codon:yes stop_codon:yes gene_type:complete
MKKFKDYVTEAKMDNFQLVDMDPDTARIAVQLAKKAGLTPKSYKSRSGGLDISVEGPKKKVAKFIMSLPNEGNLKEFKTSMTYFDKKGAAKAEKIAKGIGIYVNTKKVGKAPNFAFTVYVDGEFDKIEKWSRLIESNANWAKSLEKIQKQRQLDKISDKDKETLMKIAALLGKEKR